MKFFSHKDKVSKWVIFSIVPGIVPFNKLAEKLRKHMLLSSSILWGIFVRQLVSPEIDFCHVRELHQIDGNVTWLTMRSKLSSFVKLLRNVGTDPLSRLLLSYNVFELGNMPKPKGIYPNKLLYAKFRWHNSAISWMWCSKIPMNKFSDKSSVCKCLNVNNQWGNRNLKWFPCITNSLIFWRPHIVEFCLPKMLVLQRLILVTMLNQVSQKIPFQSH